MHQIDFDLSLEEISKIEGAAALDLSVKNGRVDKCRFKITEYKRFYTQAIKGKAALAAPALLARICGTCSNAHILAAIKAVEAALKITPSAQTLILRRLVINGLIIRDHALHLYLFVLPDLFDKDSLLDFDENDPQQHQLLHDAFNVKDAGNQLSILAGGRSVHAPFPMVGGFLKFPPADQVQKITAQLQAARPAVLRLIKTLSDWPINQTQTIPYLALTNSDYSYLSGKIKATDGWEIEATDYRNHLQKKRLPYSHASAYTYKQGFYLTGALARLNLNSAGLKPQTKTDAAAALAKFPSRNLYHNNLAQAIEILNAIDDSLAILNQTKFAPEPLNRPTINSGEGVGVIEAPRGLLYHRLKIENNIVADAEILVPTGQNQLNMENDIKILVANKLKTGALTAALKTELAKTIEVLIRAYDPCMSCASHFLKINWHG
jgi:coenzyme F420-reducing hydrogenase alpha subunit